MVTLVDRLRARLAARMHCPCAECMKLPNALLAVVAATERATSEKDIEAGFRAMDALVEALAALEEMCK